MSEHRVECVTLARQPGANRRALCRRFGIAPATANKWLHCYETEGAAGLADRSRRPHHSPARTPPAIEQAVLTLRAQHPTWSARKLGIRRVGQHVVDVTDLERPQQQPFGPQLDSLV